MITIDDTMKQRLNQLLDSDGKIAVSDDMPEDLKSAINYLNKNNVNLLAENDALADDMTIEGDEIDGDDDSYDFSSTDVSYTDNSSASKVEISEDEDIQTDDLEELF